MTSDQLRAKLRITPEQLAELLRRGLPARGKGSRRKFEPALVREWLIANGLADTTHAPRDPFLFRTVGQVANHFCVSVKTVTQWLQQGMPGRPGPRGKQDGYFPLHEIREWLAKRQAQGANSPGGTSERDRLVKVKRQREELKLGTEAGNLLPVETVGKAFLRAIHETRAQLDQLPAAIVKTLPASVNRDERDRIRRKIRAALDHAYGTLADALERQAEDQDQLPPPEEPSE
jgi:phage terminase Nu1 subunit (DNA packaging protein)